MKGGLFHRIITGIGHVAGFADNFRGRAEAIAQDIKDAIDGLRTNVGKIANAIQDFQSTTLPELRKLVGDLTSLIKDARGSLGAVSAKQDDVGLQIAKLRTDLAQHKADVGAQLDTVTAALRGNAGPSAG